MARDTGIVYRFDGTQWQPIQQIDATAINEVDSRLTAELKEMDEKINHIANAAIPLYIPTYEGSGQSCHPSIKYFPNKFKSYYYWMAYTPYPDSNDDYENPCIAVSNDGVTWIENPYAKNPIDVPTAEQLADGYHMSDTHLVWREDLQRLECWYRLNKNGAFEQILRKYTTDGATWSEREVMIEVPNATYQILSPAVIYDENKYKMWYVSRRNVRYIESVDGVTWSSEVYVPLDFTKAKRYGETGWTYYPWHLDIVKNNGQYEILASCGNSNVGLTDDRAELCHGISVDGMSFSVETIMQPTPLNSNSWDSVKLYRSSLVFVGDVVKIYYSAYNRNGKWHIGLSEGSNIKYLVGTIPSDSDSYIIPNGIKLAASQKLLLETDGGSYINAKEILLRDKGIAEGKIVIGKNSEGNAALSIYNKASTLLLNMELNELLASRVKTANFYGDSIYPNKLQQVTSYAKLRIYATQSDKGELHIVSPGVGGARLQVNEANTLEIRRDNDQYTANTKQNGIILTGEQVMTEIAGAIRWNPTTKKHQGYNGTAWVDFY
ncbi:hypothetical protein [Ureibacillus sp. FSL E2-3493]|uniref:hypothetical protein n=1 Tax=Ureibacillus sp. FSL E2-3493 TaxID=2921367 RepID=UPI00311A04A3